MFEISKENNEPLYQQLIQNIKNCIEKGIIKENEKLPSENEICKKYDLSRTVVRMALNHLEKNGYIYRVQGKGSFVTTLKIYQNRSYISKFYDDAKTSGKIPLSKILSFKLKEPNRYIKDKMNLLKNDKVVKLVWIRYGNSEPLIYETIYLNHSLVKGIEKIDLTSKKLYDILAKEYGIKKIYGKELFYPCKIEGTEAKYLAINDGCLGMKIERLVYSGNKILEYTESVVRGDRFVYTTNFKGSL